VPSFKIINNYHVVVLPLETHGALPVDLPEVLKHFRFNVGPITISTMGRVLKIILKGYTVEHWRGFKVSTMMTFRLIEPHLFACLWMVDGRWKVVPKQQTVVGVVPFVGKSVVFQKRFNALHTQKYKYSDSPYTS
jgi:hypothetical protein